MMSGLLVVLSLVGALAGFFLLSEATLGVGVIGLAALLAVYARIAQAALYQKQLMDALAGRPEADTSTPNLEQLYGVPKS